MVETGRGAETISFDLGPGVLFEYPPLVLVTPRWEGENSEVGHSETIDTVQNDGFTVVSGNAAGNYYVNWIAIGRLVPVPAAQ
jgi:hypothetical protein